MRNRLLAFCALLALIVGTAAAQDARSVLQAAATTMGVTNLGVGQNYSPELDWPRTEVPNQYHPQSGWFDEGPSKGPPPCGRGLKLRFCCSESSSSGCCSPE